MRRTMPDFEGWAVFAQVAESGSFSAAAAAFGLSNGTVSKIVSRLEARLGEPLFHRTTRTMSLTSTGRALLGRASALLVDAEAVEDAARGEADQPRGLVRMTAPLSFGLAYVTPLLPELVEALPEVTLNLDLDDRPGDLIAAGADVGLRVGWLPDTRLRARKLGAFRIFIVAAPAYLAQRPPITQPADLQAHVTTAYANVPPHDSWLLRARDGGETRVAVSNLLISNNADAMLALVRAGKALAMMPEFLVFDDLRSGRLVRVLEDWSHRSAGLFILTPSSGPRPSRVTAVLDFFADRLPGLIRRARGPDAARVDTADAAVPHGGPSPSDQGQAA